MGADQRGLGDRCLQWALVGCVCLQSTRAQVTREMWEGSGNVEESRRSKYGAEMIAVPCGTTGLGAAAAVGVAPARCHGDERRHQHKKRRHDVPQDLHPEA